MRSCFGMPRCARVVNCKHCLAYSHVKANCCISAKYPLSLVARTLEAGLGKVQFAFDIGCAFQGTLSRSSLGRRARAAGVSFCVNSFHGYGHNRICQLQHHPLYRCGFGLEDLETCERFFSSSNNVAGPIRHASHFHWSQAMDLFLLQWDEDKYAELSWCSMLFCVAVLISCRQVFVQQYRTSHAHYQRV